MTDTFAPPRCPDYSRQNRVDLRSTTIQFGDGYSSRFPNGLNAVQRTLNLTWSKLTADQAQAVEDFLTDHAGYIAFFYAVTRDAVTRKYVVNSFNRIEVAGSKRDTITATFTQVFDP